MVVKGEPRLYNLASDIHEDHNVAAEHPKILTELLAAIRKEHRDSKDFEITLPKF